MEYTKDVILDINYKREIGIVKLKNWTSKVKKVIKSNKTIIFILAMLTILIGIDIVLVNSFLELLTKLY